MAQYEIGKSVKGAAIPNITAEYTMFPVWFIVCMMISQTSPVLGAFFGVRGPDGEWPNAWWAFGMLGTIVWPIFAFPTKLRRTPDGLEWYNLFARQGAAKLSQVDSITVLKGCCSTYVSLTYTEEFLQKAKTQAGCCKCCVGRTVGIFFLQDKDMEAFCAHRSLTGGGANSTTSVSLAVP